ncbi:MAG: hypothetical protein WD023_09420 [Ilumatobacteraceae bacterium]
MTDHDERFDGVVFDDAFVHARTMRRRRTRIVLIGCVGLIGGIVLLTIEGSGEAEDIRSNVVREAVTSAG